MSELASIANVRELLAAYLTADVPHKREDARHAAWWTAQLGILPVLDLTAELIQRNAHVLTKRGRSDSTKVHYLRFLRRACRWGVKQAYLQCDPTQSIATPEPRPTALRVLTQDEEGDLAAALGEPYSLWMRFALATGFKQSEQFALRWRDVDLERAFLYLPDAYARTVVEFPLPAVAVTILRELKRLHPISSWVFPDLRAPARPANVHSFYTGRWEAAVRHARIQHVTWGDLRTTCGVRLAAQGRSAREISIFLRQREVRRAYIYRAWRPGDCYVRKPARQRAELIFKEITPEELLKQIGRDVESQPLTFKELCHLYAAHHLKEKPSRQQFERVFRRFWQPWWNRLPTELTRKEIRLWFLGLEGTPAVANKAATFLRAVFAWAIRMEILTCQNPVVGLIRFRLRPRKRFLTSEEVHRLIDHLPRVPMKPRAFLSLLLLTGARKSEALAAKWSDLDVSMQLWRKPITKNEDDQLVPLPVQALDALSLLPRDSEWVFPGQHGSHWHRTSADKEWYKIRTRLNLEDVTLHDLRRSCASYLAIAGENLPVIQNVLNHRSLGPTSVYARLNVSAVGEALQRQADRFMGTPAQ